MKFFGVRKFKVWAVIPENYDDMKDFGIGRLVLLFDEVFDWIVAPWVLEEFYFPGHALSVANLQFLELDGRGFGGGAGLDVF